MNTTPPKWLLRYTSAYFHCAGQIDNSTLGYIINHVFLPPTLPCRVDVNVEPKIQSLLGLIKGSAKAYQDGLTASKSQWDSGIKMLSMMEEIQPRGCLSSQNLDKAIGNMRTGGDAFTDMMSLGYSNKFYRCFSPAHPSAKCWANFASNGRRHHFRSV